MAIFASVAVAQQTAFTAGPLPGAVGIGSGVSTFEEIAPGGRSATPGVSDPQAKPESARVAMIDANTRDDGSRPTDTSQAAKSENGSTGIVCARANAA